MKIVGASIYALKIPFVESFGHSLSDRFHADSVIVKIITDSAVAGFGEGVPRPYVTGETRDTCVDHIAMRLLPRLLGTRLENIGIRNVLCEINRLVAGAETDDAVVWNAARCAVETAVVDGFLRANGLSLGDVLPPASRTVTYSGVISSGSDAKVESLARRCQAVGFKDVKVKVSGEEDIRRIAAVRSILGPAVSIRLDANAAFNPETTLRFLASAREYDIACIEQPIPRGDPTELADLRAASPVPIMADESVVTIRDAQELIAANAVDYWNLRLSKCGGLHNMIAIADLARSAGVGIGLGCQVGETAVLSAAGRHLAAHLRGLLFVEGSYGAHLLIGDIADEAVGFGLGGKAGILAGPGLGVDVCEELLDKYAEKVIKV